MLLAPGCGNADMVSFVSQIHSLIPSIRLDALQTSSKGGFSSTKDQIDSGVHTESLFVMPAVHLAVGTGIQLVREASTAKGQPIRRVLNRWNYCHPFLA